MGKYPAEGKIGPIIASVEGRKGTFFAGVSELDLNNVVYGQNEPKEGQRERH